MWRLVAKSLDWLAIRSACACVRPSPDGKSHAEEARALLQSPDFFAPEVSAAGLEFIDGRHFQFPSPVQSDSMVNDTVQGFCRLAGGDWRERPSAILLHGWNAELQYHFQMPRCARLLAEAGVNAFCLELPYHASRRPTYPGEISDFASGNTLHIFRATRQALAEIRALTLWLRAQGSPTVGLWGTSLGGWLSGLAAANQPGLDWAVLFTPVPRMDRALRELALAPHTRSQIAELGDSLRRISLTDHEWPLDPQRLLVVDSQHDLFVTRQTIDELCRQWGGELWRVPHSHITAMFSGALPRRIASWIEKRAATPAFDELRAAA